MASFENVLGEKGGRGEVWEVLGAGSAMEVYSGDIKAGISSGAKAAVNEILVWPFSSRSSNRCNSSSSSSSNLPVSSSSTRYVPRALT
ncbi:hypothetical protein KPH14_010368 [Odynerus spinipes]|uniref:Uncharacterized protein n=1 Tax=Odynerus spinipes TaxID=1348599 RepID=A0AAD9RTN9_9HYME|nr:hypothetical protein KPH14_010368 [Odynerus spinipes]